MPAGITSEKKIKRGTAALLRLLFVSAAIGVGCWGLLHNPLVEEQRLKGMSADRLVRECGSNSQDPLLLYYAGLRLNQAGRFAEAVSFLKQGAQLSPETARLRDEWARALLGSGHPTDAFQELRQYTQILPRSAQAHLLLGKFFFSQNSMRRAASELALATQFQPDQGEAWSYLAAACDSLADPAGTQRAAEQAVRLRPGSATDHLLLATVYDRAARSESARHEFEQAIRLAPRSAAAHREYAAWFLTHAPASSGASHAVTEARQAISLDPQDARAHLLLGTALVRQSDTEGAISPLTLAAQAMPEDPKPAIALRELYHAAGNGPATAHWQVETLARQKYAATRRQLTEQIEVHPSESEPHRRMAHFCAAHGEVEECVRQTASALHCTPDAPQALMAASRDLLASGFASQAIPLARQAAQRSADPDANELLGDTLLANDRWHEASIAYQAAAEAQPARMERLRARLKLYFERRDTKRSPAERAYAEAVRIEGTQIGPKRITPRVETLAQQAVSLDPQNPRYLRYLLHIQTARRIHDQAIQTAKQLLALKPDDPTAHATLAILLLEKAARPEEQAEVERHLRAANAPELEATRHYGLGLLALKRHDAATAVRELEQSVQMDPSSELGYYKLAQAQTLAGNPRAAQEAMARHARIQSIKSRESNLLGDIAQHPNVPSGYRHAIAYFQQQGSMPQASAIRAEAQRRFGSAWSDSKEQTSLRVRSGRK